tara:strand:- start:477 stop:1073 length:597 start_codon:yes stop_codon:yes gene_type:complete
MIKFLNNDNSKPFIAFRELYSAAIENNQQSIEAISISSYDTIASEVNSRFVNLKFVNKDKFIFFTNYDSPKSKEFKSHKQISASIFWESINAQIRINATIKKTPIEFNNEYFSKRSKEKNALAISSNQSNRIETYHDIETKYNQAKDTKNLRECPSYWGGYSFTPYKIEFWKGNKFRINKRDLYELIDDEWVHSILEP